MDWKERKYFGFKECTVLRENMAPTVQSVDTLKPGEPRKRRELSSPPTDSGRSQLLGTPPGLGALGRRRHQKRIHSSYRVLGRVGTALVPQATVLFSRRKISQGEQVQRKCWRKVGTGRLAQEQTQKSTWRQLGLEMAVKRWRWALNQGTYSSNTKWRERTCPEQSVRGICLTNYNAMYVM